ncbi:substrate-binding periplasmic protein [Fervidobacterium sp.]
MLNKVRFIMISSLILMNLFLIIVSNTFATILYTYPQDTPPKYFMKGTEISGFCHDIIVELNKELKAQDIKIEYKSKVLKSTTELLNALKNGEIQIFVGYGHSVERTKDFNYVSIPLYASREMFMVETNLKDKILQKNIVKIGAVEGTIPAENVPQIAKNQEVIRYKTINDVYKALEKREIDLVFSVGLLIGDVINASKGKYTTLNLTTRKFYHYIILNKNVGNEIIAKIEAVLKKIHEKGIMQRLIKKYNLQQYVLPGNVLEILVADWKPYSWYDENKNEWVGVDVDVARTVLNKLGYQTIFLTYPRVRCLEYMKSGTYDAVMSLCATADRKAFLLFPDEPLSTGKDVLFKLKESKIDIADLRKIPEQARCGYTDGYAYGDWFWNAKFKKINVASDEAGFKLLENRRIDLFVCNLLVGRQLAKELNIDVVSSPVFGEKMIYYIAFSQNYHGTNLLKSVSQELKHFKRTKEYLNILSGYGISYDDFWK